ncbi:hypothetical protein PTW35_14495 [Photobacterium sp. DA100]|uniref:hypothetical protein n=1 Tax=Photobacterium sp. DA100 TaxID=3027472 RepID=UPI00247894F2|nr:hypothetical protein [Photobacterium sp. DA100]WEM41802.1 hypothetical protein PTW35_14495 [Photobacterium sp. DA100]
MIRKQSGMMSLLITAIMLVAALMMTLGASRTVFYQIKRADNELAARKAYWAAEGGLECAFTKASVDLDPAMLDDSIYPGYLASECKSPLALSVLKYQLSGTHYDVISEYSTQGIKKRLVKTMAFEGSAPGALKSTADLYIYGSSAFSTPDPGVLGPEGWQCVAINYKRIFSSHSGAANLGLIHGAAPYQGFDSQGFDCADSHMTNVSSNSGYGADFVQTTGLDPFFDMFKRDKSDWNEVRTSSEWGFSTINASKTVSISGVDYGIVENCGEKLASKVEAGVSHIWVEGSCELTSGVGGGVEKLSEAFTSKGNPATFLMIHDGIFSIQGSMTFPGMLYHLTTDFTPVEALWGEFEANSHFGNAVYFPTLTKGNTVYFQRGAFVFSGGQILDTENLDAYFAQSLNFAFNKDKIDDVTLVLPPVWIEGSWHDF